MPVFTSTILCLLSWPSDDSPKKRQSLWGRHKDSRRNHPLRNLHLACVAPGNNELALIRTCHGTWQGFPIQGPLCPGAEMMRVVQPMHLGSLPPLQQAMVIEQPWPLTHPWNHPLSPGADCHDTDSCSRHPSLLTATSQPHATMRKLAGPCPGSWHGPWGQSPLVAGYLSAPFFWKLEQ